MDGLAPDANVTFLLTTNRADLLEPALAERPGGAAGPAPGTPMGADAVIPAWRTPPPDWPLRR